MAFNKVTQKENKLQNKYLNHSWKQNISPVRDYRYETGFRFKKVMYAHRFINYTKQNVIRVTFDIYDFTCNQRLELDGIPNSNYCKVCPVIIPYLTLNKNHAKQITNYCKTNDIWGAFLYTFQTLDPGNVFGGRLNLVTVTNYDPAINCGTFSAVYPYYEYRFRAYVPYLEFNHLNNNPTYLQCRFTLIERTWGVHECGTAEALYRIRDHCNTLYANPNDPNKRFVAFYVEQYATLAVLFQNNSNLPEYDDDRGFVNKAFCHHERVLVQHHGLVGLQNYNLTFRFSAKQNNQEYDFQELAQLTNQKIIYQHPLIAVRRVTDPAEQKGKQPHFAGYYLEIFNLPQIKTACLIFPSDFVITIHELMPGVEAGKMVESEGLKYMREQWLGEKFTDLTGPFSLVTDGRTRQAFPNSFY